MIEIVEVTRRRDLDDFICFPFALYADDPYYVPPLVREAKKQFSDGNPFFFHAEVRYFLAKKKGKIQGRIVSIVNHAHNEFHHERTGFFGFFDSIDDREVAGALIGSVCEDLRKKEMDTVRGPMNFSTNEECGMLIDGFDSSPMLMTPYNPPYYVPLLESCGLKKAKDLYAYIYDVLEKPPDKIIRVAAIAERSGITFRQVDMKHFGREMMIFKEVYNSAWEKNWGFVPLTDAETAFLAENLKPVVVPDLTLIAEKNGDPVGFLGLLPDFNFVLKRMKGKMNPLSLVKALYYSKKIPNVRLLLLGIKADHRNRGVEALLFREGFKGVRKGGYKRVEFSWILEDNIPTQRLVEMIGGRLNKTYRIYEKPLT
ncbi:MAG: N-acetyltransferase [Nitrospirota bacterium]